MKFLHVGCGPKHKDQTNAVFAAPEWQEVRLDVDPSVKPDVIGTMTEMDAISDGSMDAVFSSHNIEHLYPHEVPVALAEFHRVLGAEGYAVITCPDLRSVAKLIAEDKLGDPAYMSPAGPITPLDIVFGHNRSLAGGNLYMAHHTGFTEKTLRAALLGAGFASIATLARPSRFDLWALACKKETPAEELKSRAMAHFV